MSSEWCQTKWGDISILHYGKRLTNYKNKNGEFDVYASSGIVGTCDEYLCPNSGVIVGRKGNLGFHYSDKPFFVIDTAFWLETSEVVDDKWSYYKLISENISYLDSGSAIPSMSRESFYSLPVLLPSLNEQKKIAEILTGLENKIELNNKINKTLEEISKSLFKSWFIDFDPTKARIEGSSAGLPDEIRDLFPDSFEDSELGAIPFGWNISKIGDISENFDRKRVPLSKKDRSTRKGKFPYFGATGIFDYVDNFLFDGTYLLIGEDGTVENANGTAFTQYVEGKIWVNNHAHVLKGIDPISTEFLYCFFQFFKINPYITGAVQLKLSQGRMNMIRLPIPDNNCLKIFDQQVKPLFSRIILNKKETVTLESIRDAMLPKLISGELRIPDAEKIIEEVGI